MNEKRWTGLVLLNYASGSFVDFISFEKARLWTGGVGTIWPQSLNGGRISNGQNGDNYLTRTTATSSGTGQETGGEGGGTGEICKIKH